ncbi:hypothetical protein LCGC14_2015930 [marine sediment metagenome]|uniref:Uncharacterized protein n=1 Tax=marine sediment metagenome TaxID=412755 RepID=A0A0F9EZ05_9ZZZZ
MASRKRFRTETVEASIEDALDGAADIRTLYEEMEEWQSSFEGANMEHMLKYDEVTAAVEALEECGEVERIADEIKESEAVLEEKITYVRISPYGKKPEPRWMTCANACNMLQAVAEHINNEELTEALSEMETVDFPSMY